MTFSAYVSGERVSVCGCSYGIYLSLSPFALEMGMSDDERCRFAHIHSHLAYSQRLQDKGRDTATQ